MTGRRTCPYENAVYQSARTGRWDTALRDHVAGCVVCRDVSVITQALRVLADVPMAPDDRRPDPRLLWWKARLFQDVEDSPGLRPLIGLQDLGRIAAGALAATVLWVLWPTWQTEFIRFWTARLEGWDLPYIGAVWQSLAPAVFGVGIGLLGSTLSWALGRLLTDE